MTKLTIGQVLQKGKEAQEAGELKEAERLYEEILKVQPKHSDANYNIGLLAMSVGNTTKALPFLKRALKANPNRAQFWHSYITALINLDRLAEARIVFAQVKSNGAKGSGFSQIERNLEQARGKSLIRPGDIRDSKQYPHQDQLRSLMNLYTRGKMAAVIKRSKTLSKKYPNAKIIWNLMGASAVQIGQLDQAIFAFQKVLAINPDDADGHNNLANAYLEQGKLTEALEAYSKALSLRLDYADACNGIGVVLAKQGKLSEALKAYRKVLAIKPDYAEAHNNMGNAFKEQEMFEEAIEAYSKALSLKPDYAEAYNNIGNALKEQGKFEEAIEAFGKALIIKPDYSQVHFYLSALITYDAEHPQISEVETLLQCSKLSGSDRCHLHYTYAKMKEDLGEFDTAFDSYLAAGKLRKEELAYDFVQDRRKFIVIKKTAPRFKQLFTSEPEISKQIPIFILGMPRSGTTLVEQIVSAHTEVSGAGELNWVAQFGSDLVFDRTPINNKTLLVFRECYLAELAKSADGRRFLTDKMPENFLYIALIRAALPEAKIVHVQRTGEAVCWSNFKHYFSSKSLGYSYNLKDTVGYFGLYKDLMRFWCESYDRQIYHLSYEELTENQEPEIRRLIEYLGLNWEDACLAPQNNERSVKTASQLQVRQPIFMDSSQAWRKYEPFLKGVFDGLET